MKHIPNLSVWSITGTDDALYQADMPYCCGRQTNGPVRSFVCTVCGAAYEKATGDAKTKERASKTGHLIGAELSAKAKARQRGWLTGDIHQTDRWFREGRS